MEQINGKVIVFTDLHLGLKNASKNRLGICIQIIKNIINYAEKHNIKHCIFCGDWHHSRVSTENNVLNISYKLAKTLAKHLNIKFILGNHDIYMKNSLDINSLVMFNDIKNVEIINKPTYITLNNAVSLLVPWAANLDVYEKESVDILFGHFEATRNYLIKSYLQEHTADTSVNNNLNNIIDNELELKQKTEQPGDYIGNFIDIVKKNGIIFSGHIHNRKEFVAKGRNFIFVGSPYEQTLGEIDTTHGFYVINEDNSYEFIESTNVPKHIILRISQIVNNFNSFDFSIIKNNIIQKYYDVNVDRVTDAKIEQKINDLHPYEELTPEYNILSQSDSEFNIQNQQIELIQKSKLEYIYNYIQNIDDESLKSENINKEKLFAILKEYYELITDE